MVDPVSHSGHFRSKGLRKQRVFCSLGQDPLGGHLDPSGCQGELSLCEHGGARLGQRFTAGEAARHPLAVWRGPSCEEKDLPEHGFYSFAKLGQAELPTVQVATAMCPNTNTQTQREA